MTIRGRTHTFRLCAFLMKYVSIFSVTSKSAMTPSFIGLMATMFPGVRPSMSFASLPTASTRPLTLLIATIDGSLTTIPLPRAYTQVFAVRGRRGWSAVLAGVLLEIHRRLGLANQRLGGIRGLGQRGDADRRRQADSEARAGEKGMRRKAPANTRADRPGAGAARVGQ